MNTQEAQRRRRWICIIYIPVIFGFITSALHGAEPRPAPEEVGVILLDDGFRIVWKSQPGFSYRIDKRVDDAAVKPIEIAAGKSQYEDKDVKAGSVYGYRVRSIDTAGAESIWSVPIRVPFKELNHRFSILSPSDHTDISPSTQPTITWEKMDDATGYKVDFRRSAAHKGDDKDAINVGTLTSGDTTSYSLPPNVHPTPGREYAVDVVALLPDKKSVAAINSPLTLGAPTFFDQLAKSVGLTLQRSFGQDGDNAAQVSWMDSRKSDAQFSADFALRYDLRKPFGDVWNQFPESLRSWDPQISLEGHLAPKDNANKQSQDVLRLRLGAEYGWTRLDETPAAFYLSTAVKYEADSDFDTEALSFELLASPSIPTWGIGAYITPQELFNKFTGKSLTDAERQAQSWEETKSGLLFRLRPFIGIDAGKTMDRPKPQPGTPAVNDEVLRLKAELRGQVSLPDVAHWSHLREVRLFADDTWLYLPLNEEVDHNHNFLTTGLELYVTDNASFNLTYKIGEDAPAFTHVESFNAGIGLKF